VTLKADEERMRAFRLRIDFERYGPANSIPADSEVIDALKLDRNTAARSFG
jgi:hypothetical protein